MPAFFDSPLQSFAGALLLPPHTLVARYRSSGMLQCVNALRQRRSVYANDSPLACALRAVPPYVVSYHENDTLQTINTDSGALGVLNFAKVFGGEPSRARVVLANERWVIVASRQVRRLPSLCLLRFRASHVITTHGCCCRRGYAVGRGD